MIPKLAKSEAIQYDQNTILSQQGKRTYLLMDFNLARNEVPETHALFIEQLISKGFAYKGLTYTNGTNVHLESGVTSLMLNTSRQELEITTENINPYELWDNGHHSWFFPAESTEKEIAEMVNLVTSISGND